jgi:hypothetical protein
MKSLALIAILTLALAGSAVAAGGKTFKVKLSGSAETPKGASKGSGTAEIKITGGVLCWKFTSIAGIDTPTASHIHQAGSGKAGPVVLPLGSKYKSSGCTAIPRKLQDAILSKSSDYYVNIHTAKYPGGAVRGQL